MFNQKNSEKDKLAVNNFLKYYNKILKDNYDIYSVGIEYNKVLINTVNKDFYKSESEIIINLRYNEDFVLISKLNGSACLLETKYTSSVDYVSINKEAYESYLKHAENYKEDLLSEVKICFYINDSHALFIIPIQKIILRKTHHERMSDYDFDGQYYYPKVGQTSGSSKPYGLVNFTEVFNDGEFILLKDLGIKKVSG